MANFKIPSHDDIQMVLDYIKIILPSPILVFSIVCFLRMNEVQKTLSFLTILLSVYHGVNIYEAINGSKMNTDPIYKRIWLSFDLHLLVFIFAVRISGLRPILFFVDIIVVEFIYFIKVIHDHLAPRLQDVKEPIQNFCKACIKNELIKKCRAVMEIVLIPYFFFASLFTLRSEVFIAFLFYLLGYAAFMLVYDYYHMWAWHELRENLIKIVCKYVPDNQDKILNILDNFKQVPDYVRKVYPIPASFIDTVKLHME